MWAILKCFGYGDLPEKLKGSGIHGLYNVVTLDLSCYAWFHMLELWFEAVVGVFFFLDNVIQTEGPQKGSPNTYMIKATSRTHLTSCKAEDGKITLTSASPGLPLPNPVYLEIHAACCRVAHLSGAGEYMDKLLEDLEGTSVLSEDGSSAHVLSFVLQQEEIASEVIS